MPAELGVQLGDYSREKLQGRRDVMYEHLRDVRRCDSRGVLRHVPDRPISVGYGRRLSALIDHG